MRVALLSVLLIAAASVTGPACATADAAAERRIAVLYFENNGNPELEMLKLGLAEMLISDLAGTPGIEVIERGRINDLLGELDLQKTDKVDANTAVEMGKLLGVERVIVGSYFELMGQFQLMGRVIEVETGVIVGANQQSGAVAEFMALEDELATGLLPFLADVPIEGTRGGSGGGAASKKDAGRAESPGPTKSAGMDIGSTRGIQRDSGGSVRRGDSDDAREEERSGRAEREYREAEEAESAAEAESVAEIEPTDPLGAALAFSEGLDYLDRKDITRARDSLRRAVELDPTLTAAQDELANIDI